MMNNNAASNSLTKAQLLALDDQALLRECRFEARRGTGPGGQKRNKTSTAARVTHVASGIAATDDATRSQHRNLAAALQKLRLTLAAQLPPDNPAPHAPTMALEPPPPRRSREFIPWVGEIFDQLIIADYEVTPVAEVYGCTPGRLLRVLGKDDDIWQLLSQGRQRRGLPVLHR